MVVTGKRKWCYSGWYAVVPTGKSCKAATTMSARSLRSWSASPKAVALWVGACSWLIASAHLCVYMGKQVVPGGCVEGVRLGDGVDKKSCPGCLKLKSVFGLCCFCFSCCRDQEGPCPRDSAASHHVGNYEGITRSSAREYSALSF